MTRDPSLFDNVAQGERSSERKSDTTNNYMARFVIGGFDKQLTIDYSRGAEVCADWRAEKETAMRPYRFGLYVAIMAALIRVQGFAGEASGDSAGDAVLKTREGPLATITRELYMPSPRAGQSYVIGNQYVGYEGAERLQVRTLQVHDDVYQDATFRRSPDNGRTWSDFERDPERDIVVNDGYARNHYVFPGCYDPIAGRMVRMTLLRTHKGDPRVSGLSTYWDHTLWQTSVDNGRTWDTARLLKYEEGAEYDAEDFGNLEFLTRNGSYSGYNVIPLQEGGIAMACSLTTESVNEDGVKEPVCGVMLFVGQWDTTENTYVWSHSNPVAVSRRISDRGLMEPWVAQLGNGNLMVSMRGNATAANPGRSFYAVSVDGGKTLSEARELRFDDGAPFYAPSSMTMMLRHSMTGKLYWFGNISDTPTQGNSPRYPLYIAEVDEEQPALRRATLTVIDDYDPQTQTPAVQFSNFSLVEDRETHAFEMYMTVWGEYPNVYQAHVYRYLIALK